MNIYLLEQDYVDGYDTYDSAVVIAENADEAKYIHPSSFVTHVSDDKWMGTFSKGGEYEHDTDCWPKYSDVDQIKVTCLGESTATKSRLVLSSFNAG